MVSEAPTIKIEILLNDAKIKNFTGWSQPTSARAP